MEWRPNIRPIGSPIHRTKASGKKTFSATAAPNVSQQDISPHRGRRHVLHSTGHHRIFLDDELLHGAPHSTAPVVRQASPSWLQSSPSPSSSLALEETKSRPDSTLNVLGPRKRTVVDSRDGMGAVAPGDKGYVNPEYSNDFYKQEGIVPKANFGYERTQKSLLDLPAYGGSITWNSDRGRERTAMRFSDRVRLEEHNSAVQDVVALNAWESTKL